MAGRPPIKKADIPALKKLTGNNNHLNTIDLNPIIAYTMWKCGCTFAEIGQVIGSTRQNAEYLVRSTEAKL